MPTASPHAFVALLGYGRFGRALGRLLLEAGVAHRAYDPDVDVPADHRAATLEELTSGAEFIVVAVPVPLIGQALTTLRPYIEPSQVVFDVGSVKVRPARAMQDTFGSAVAWCGTHPLFGPVSMALAERPLRVVLCPAPGHAVAAARVRALYERIGCEVIEQTPEGHDRVMAHTHALTFFVAKGMIDAGAGMEVPFAPPSFQAMARAIEVVRSDGGHLFAAIARDNPFAAEARKELVHALDAIDRALDSQLGDDNPSDDETPSAARFSIPDLGQKSPELRETREHIDAIDRGIVGLLAQRAQLQERAARVKAAIGAPVLDAARETKLLGARRAWASDMNLDEDGVIDVFRAILTMSRRAQRT